MKKLSYEVIPINLIKDGGEHLTENYGAINPMHQVPTIDIDGVTLTQSISIIEYIDEIYTSGPKLLPGNALQRAQARCIAEIINSGIQPLQNLKTVKVVKEINPNWTHDGFMVRDGFKAIEAILFKTAKTYCVGDEISIADICLVPQVYNANRSKMNMKQFPLINKINSTLLLNEAFQQASPNAQPDCPEDRR